MRFAASAFLNRLTDMLRGHCRQLCFRNRFSLKSPYSRISMLVSQGFPDLKFLWTCYSIESCSLIRDTSGLSTAKHFNFQIWQCCPPMLTVNTEQNPPFCRRLLLPGLGEQVDQRTLWRLALPLPLGKLDGNLLFRHRCYCSGAS